MNKIKVMKYFFCDKTIRSSNKTDINAIKKSILDRVSNIKDTNIRDYYYRRYEYDFNSGNILEDNKVQEELKKLDRIVTVQNMYYSKNSILD